MTKMIIMAKMIMEANKASLENANTSPATVIKGAGSSISTVAEKAICIWLTSLVLRVINDAAPNLLKSLIEKSCTLRNIAPRMSLPNAVEIYVEVNVPQIEKTAVDSATISISLPVFHT